MESEHIEREIVADLHAAATPDLVETLDPNATVVGSALVSIASVSLRHAVEKRDDAGIEGVLGTDDQQLVLRDEFFQHAGTVSEMIDRSANVGANGFRYQRVLVHRLAGRKQRFDGRSYPIDDGPQVLRPDIRLTPQLFQGGQNSATARSDRER